MRVMLAIRVAAALGTLAMALGIVVAFSAASFTEDGAALLALAWGRVTLLDTYLALLLGWSWIAWRERAPARAAAWLVATVVTGSLALFAYVLGASLRASDPSELVIGPRRAVRNDAAVPHR
jgi:hypothetical protein